MTTLTPNLLIEGADLIDGTGGPVNRDAMVLIESERLMVAEAVDARIITQRMPGPVLRAILDVAHAHDRPVVGQTWALDGREAAELGIDELDNSSRVFGSREFPAERLLNYTSIPDRLALSGRGWAAIDWEATKPIMEAMLSNEVSYCPMLVACQIPAGDGVAELEADPDFIGLFGEAERRDFHAFMERLSGGWTAEDLRYWKKANENRLEWIRRVSAKGGERGGGNAVQCGGGAQQQGVRKPPPSGRGHGA